MNIHDIAKMANVSSAAVSRYLNGGPLSAEKRAAIHAVIEKTGYRPDAAAQTLRTGRLNQIGVIAPSFNAHMLGEIASGISETLDAGQYLMLMANTACDTQRELRYLETMQRSHVAGIILLGTADSPIHVQAFRSCRVPLVLVGQSFPDVPCVCSDDRAATRDLAQRMLDHGRRRIVYIGGPERGITTGQQRRLGVQDALNAAGQDGEHLTRICCNAFTFEEGERCMTELLLRCPELDGVVCADDVVALGAMSALREAGRTVGGDVGLAGLGDNWAGNAVQPGLTTVRFYHHQVGCEAARMLMERIENRTAEYPMRQVTLGYTVVERGSL